MPPVIKSLVESIPFHPFFLRYRLRERLAICSGPPYRPSHKRIVIDITTSCNLHCVDCCRSCGVNQAISDENLSLEQIEKFISQSIEQKRKWEEIVIEGGEPTLHPDLPGIIELLLDFRKKYALHTQIKVLTNGFSEESKKMTHFLIKKNIDVFNSHKTSHHNQDHCGFNYAPCDLSEFRGFDFSQGCYLPAFNGLGLTRHGYYPHPICGGIDSVFGFDVGRKRLPGKQDFMRDLFKKLCPLCGMFRYAFYRYANKRLSSPGRDPLRGIMSPTWKNAYDRHRLKKPELTEY